jgi:RNA polymerase sigma-70 factor (ECF subfamily)
MEENLELVRRAKRGDVDAFAQIYGQVYGEMYRFALYTLKNTADAEDAVSEAVAVAFESIRRLRKEEAFRGWIFKILTNKCRDKLRGYAKKMYELDESVSEEEPAYSTEENVMVRHVFMELADDERLIIGLHVFGGYKSREIAEILHMNENTVRSKESRGLKKMSAELTRDGEIIYDRK